jgi:hypothetical protein
MYNLSVTTNTTFTGDFNVKKIHAYFCYGDNLVGARCTTRYGFPQGRHWAHFSNEYAIFEMPANENTSKRQTEGTFFVLAYDIDYDYYVGAVLYDIYRDSPESAGFSVIKDASYDVIGCFQFDFQPDSQDVLRCVCLHGPEDSDHDNFDPESQFDKHDLREYSGYGMEKYSQRFDSGPHSQEYWAQVPSMWQRRRQRHKN